MFISHEKHNYCTHSQMVCLYNVTGCVIKRYTSYYAQPSLWVFSRDYCVETDMKQDGKVYSKMELRDFRDLILSFGTDMLANIKHLLQHQSHALKFKTERMGSFSEADVLCT
jgi:hypothetical protein